MCSLSASQVQTYANYVWVPTDGIEVRCLAPPGAKEKGSPRFWLFAKNINAYLPTLRKLNLQGYGIYVGVLPRRQYGGGKDEDVLGSWVVWADFDHTTVDAVIQTITDRNFPTPGMLVNSGHGVHCYWRVDRYVCAEDIVKLVKGISVYLGADPKVANASRVMRLPGFMNTKPPQDTECKIVNIDQNTCYQFEELRSSVPQAVERPKPALYGGQTAPSPANNVEERAIAYINKMPPAISGNGGHKMTYKVAVILVRGFMLSQEKALEIMSDRYNPRCEPQWTEKELRHKVSDAASRPCHNPDGWLLKPNREVSLSSSAYTTNAYCT